MGLSLVWGGELCVLLEEFSRGVRSSQGFDAPNSSKLQIDEFGASTRPSPEGDGLELEIKEWWRVIEQQEVEHKHQREADPPGDIWPPKKHAPVGASTFSR